MRKSKTASLESSYDEYMPKKVKTKLVQFQVDTTMHDKLKQILNQNEWTWSQLVNGVLKAYLATKK